MHAHTTVGTRYSHHYIRREQPLPNPTPILSAFLFGAGLREFSYIKKAFSLCLAEGVHAREISSGVLGVA